MRSSTLSFTQGGGHGGSHPHLVHEFVSALLDKREPYPNAAESANITWVLAFWLMNPRWKAGP